MKTEEEIKSKIEELESEAEENKNEFQEKLEDEGIEEDSDEGEKLRAEYDYKNEILKKQIDVLEWVLGE